MESDAHPTRLCPACRRVPMLAHPPDADSVDRARLILQVGFCHCRCRHCGLSVTRDRGGRWIHLANDQPGCRSGATVAEPASTPPPNETPKQRPEETP